MVLSGKLEKHGTRLGGITGGHWDSRIVSLRSDGSLQWRKELPVRACLTTSLL